MHYFIRTLCIAGFLLAYFHHNYVFVSNSPHQLCYVPSNITTLPSPVIRKQTQIYKYM